MTVPIVKRECSSCHELTNSLKMCSGCKTQGYCSKDCQRADWKEHKQICQGVTTGKPAVSRHPVIKVAEKLVADEELMNIVDTILISALDLKDHPENAQQYAVDLWARVEATDGSLVMRMLQASMAGRAESNPDKVPKTMQIVRADLRRESDIPPGLHNIAHEMVKQRTMNNTRGELDKWDVLVRALWRPTDIEGNETSPATVYFCRWYSRQAIEVAMRIQRPDRPKTHKMTTQDYITSFNIMAIREPDFKKKLTIMVHTPDHLKGDEDE